MVTVGVVSAGHMGSGLGGALRRGGARVVTTLDGRSARSARMAAGADLDVLGALDDVVAAADVVLSVVPPQHARAVATAIAAAASQTGVTPLVVDLNAVSPSLVGEVQDVLGGAGLDLVDGSISGPPPSVRPGARIYLSGPRCAEVAQLAWTQVELRVLPGPVGTASALKMCSASVYKGTTALVAHALLTAEHHGLLDEVVDELRAGLGRDPVHGVAVAASKAWRFVPEMREIAATQGEAGLDPALFEAIGRLYERLAAGGLGQADAETVADETPARDVVPKLLRPPNA